MASPQAMCCSEADVVSLPSARLSTDALMVFPSCLPHAPRALVPSSLPPLPPCRTLLFTIDDVVSFQRERRCYCAHRKGSRDGCYFEVDTQFEKQLVEFHPAAAHFYVQRGLSALLVDLREAMELPTGAALSRRSQGKGVRIYGWRAIGRSGKERSNVWSDEDAIGKVSERYDVSGRSRREEGDPWEENGTDDLRVLCSADLAVGASCSSDSSSPER